MKVCWSGGALLACLFVSMAVNPSVGDALCSGQPSVSELSKLRRQYEARHLGGTQD